MEKQANPILHIRGPHHSFVFYLHKVYNIHAIQNCASTSSTLTCDKSATSMPMSKCLRKIVIVIVTGSTEPDWEKENVGKIIKMFMDLKTEAIGCRSTKAVKFVPP